MIEKLNSMHERMMMAKINEIINHLNEQKYLEKEAIADRKLALKTEKMFVDMAETEQIKNPEFLYQTREPKWKVGDQYWYIEAAGTSITTHWKVDWGFISPTDIIIPSSNIDKSKIDLNYFKTKESAEKALAEIKQIMEKYE